MKADLASYLKKAGIDQAEMQAELERGQEGKEDVYWLHGDQLGTANYVTNTGNETTQFFLNLPFGETMAEQMTGAYNNPYKFNAKELDDETDLYYYGARYYNPRISIWYGTDPLAEKYPGWSPYNYVFDNPVRFIDPTGMEPKDDHFNKYGRYMYTDREKTHYVIIHTDQGNVKLSQLDYSSKGTTKAVSNVLAYYAGKKNISGYSGLATMPSETVGGFTNPITKNIFFNINQLKRGTYDNAYNIKSTLNHEGGALGHKNENIKPNDYTFVDHSKVYLNEALSPDFIKTTDGYKAGQASSFVNHVLNADIKENSYGTNYLDMLDEYNQNKAGVQVGIDTGGGPTKGAIINVTVNGHSYESKYKDLKRPQD